MLPCQTGCPSYREGCHKTCPQWRLFQEKQRAQRQAKDHADNGSLSQSSGFFAFEGCHSDSFLLFLIFRTCALLFLCDLLLIRLLS